jgi:hypothetical protein
MAAQPAASPEAPGVRPRPSIVTGFGLTARNRPENALLPPMLRHLNPPASRRAPRVDEKIAARLHGAHPLDGSRLRSLKRPASAATRKITVPACYPAPTSGVPYASCGASHATCPVSAGTWW